MFDKLQKAWNFWGWDGTLFMLCAIVPLTFVIWSPFVFKEVVNIPNSKNDYIFQVFKLMDDVTNDNSIYHKEKLRILHKLADLQNELQPYSK